MREIKNSKHMFRKSERGNVFFTLFGAVAVVGVLGAGIMATMRGPLSTMVEVNRRTQADAEMSIASKLVLLEATEQPDSGDCDADGYVEPLPWLDAGANPKPTGGGLLPNEVGSNKEDPWGTLYGYCAWDAGTDDCGSPNRLAGTGTDDETYTVLAIVSAGPDKEFQTTCAANGSITKAPDSDDIVSDFDYAAATAATGGLWNIKSGTPTTAEIDKDIEVQGTGKFQGGIDLSDPAFSPSAQLKLGAASMLMPTQAELSDCDSANHLLVRINTGTNPPSMEICNAPTDPGAWESVSAGAAVGPWEVVDATHIYYGAAPGVNVGIGTNSPTHALEVHGNVFVDGTVALNSGESLTWGTGTATLVGSAGSLEIIAGSGSPQMAIFETRIGTNVDVEIVGTNNDSSTNALGVFNSDLTGILIVRNDGKIGVNEENPNDELDVSGTIDSTGGYKVEGNLVVDIPAGTPKTILLGTGAGLNATGNGNTIAGFGAGNTLTTGEDNVLIGQGTDVPGAATSNYMNLGNAIHADLTPANPRVGIGHGANHDVSSFDDTLEVNGSVDATGEIHSDKDVTATENIIATLDVTGENLHAGTEIFVDGDLFGPPEDCTDSQKLSWEDGSGWDCITDLQGGSGGGPAGLADVLGESDDAEGLNAFNFLQVGSNEFCNEDLSICFDPEDVAGGGIFELDDTGTPTAVRTNDSIAPWAGMDFVFGSSTLDSNGDVTQNARVLFDKSKGAFRAGNVSGTQWNDANRGANSVAFGYNAQASGAGSFAGGTGNIGDSVASGIGSFAWGNRVAGAVTASGEGSVSIGNSNTASGYGSAAIGTGVIASNSGSFALGRDVASSGANSFAFGAGVTAFGADPVVSGASSVGFFMGSQTGGIDVATANTVAFLGGKIIVDPAAPATHLAASTGGEEDLTVDVEGALGAQNYCDEDGNNCFVAGDISEDIWSEDGTNNYIEYDDALGGTRIGKVTGQPAPATDWYINIGSSVVYNTGMKVGIGTSAPSTGAQALELDVEGDIGAVNYCDNSGNNCFTASQVGNDVFEVDASPGYNVVRTVDGTAPWQDSSFVIGSAQLDDTGDSNNDVRMFFSKLKGAFRAGEVTSTQWDDSEVGSHSAAFGWETKAGGDHSFVAGANSWAMGGASAALGAGAFALGDSSMAFGSELQGTNAHAIAIGRHVAVSGTMSAGFGLGAPGNDDKAVVSADNAFGVFMGDHPNVDISTNNTMGILGGTVVIDAAIPATQTAASTGGDYDLVLDVEGATGSKYYCDEDGNDCFVASDVGGSAGVFEVTGAAGSEVVRQVAADAPLATSDFVFGSSQLDDTGIADEDSRMFFDKSKSAFRAGNVGGTQWDDANVGQNSAAFGSGNEASATYTFASGRGNVVSGPGSAVFGVDNTVTNQTAVAFGNNSTVSGENAAAFGSGTTASGYSSIVGGINSTASGDYSHAWGNATAATANYAFAHGFGITASGANSLALGYETTVEGVRSVALGLGDSSTATFPKVSATNSIGIFMGDQQGVDIQEDNTFALMGGTMVVGDVAASTGGEQNLELDVEGDIGAINYCDEDGNNCFTASEVGGSAGVFEVTGAAGSELVRQVASSAPLATSDFLFGSTQLDDTGNADHDSRMFFDKSKGAFRAGIATGTEWDNASVGTGSVAFGTTAQASGDYSFAMGNATVRATGIRSFAFGSSSTQASADASFAMGNFALASATNTFSFGYHTVASGTYAVAIGQQVQATGTKSFAYGHEVIAGDGSQTSVVPTAGEGQYSFALGLGDSGAADSTTYPRVTGNNSFAVFSGDQVGVNVNAANTAAFLGTKMIINPDTTSASPAVPATTGAGLELHVVGDVGAAQYCDEAGDNCFEAGDVGGSSVFEVTGAAGSELVRQVTADAPIATSDFVFGSSQLASLGAGADDGDNRMFFDKSKGAFRAGISMEDDWDDANVGVGSTAFGLDTVASGDYSMAWGDWDARATEYASTAWGGDTVASGEYSTAFGFENEATGSGSLSGGAGGLQWARNIASGDGSIALGSSMRASGNLAIALGNQAWSGSGTAGDGNGDHSIVFGLQSANHTTDPKVTGDRSMVLFFDSNTANANSTYDFTANDKFAIIGGELQIDNQSSTANKGCIRYNSGTTKLEYSHDCSVYADMGTSTNSVFEVTGGAGSEVVRQVAAQAPLATSDFVFGSTQLADTGTAAHDNRMFFDKSKGAFRAGTATDTSWDDTNVGASSIALGKDNVASGANSVAMGAYNDAIGTESVAIGEGNTASGTRSLATGYYSTASGNYSVALGGYTALAEGNYSVAAGNGAEAYGQGSFAFGTYIAAEGANSLAMGYNIYTYGAKSIAMGDGAYTGDGSTPGSGDHSLAIALGDHTGGSAGVTGQNSAGFFMGPQEGVEITENNTFGILGGKVIIDSSVPATQTAASVGGDADLTLDVEGNMGAKNYCDENGNDCFQAIDVQSPAVFEVTGAAGSELVRQIAANAPIATSDFLFGSTSLSDIPGTDDDFRMYFDKNLGAFRAAGAGSTELNPANVGVASAGFGTINTVAGDFSLGAGQSNNLTSAATHSVVFGQGNTVSGTHSMAWGSGNQATQVSSTAWGGGTIASGMHSTAFGFENVASGAGSLAWGNGGDDGSNTASATDSTAFGSSTIASAVGATAFGETTTASGSYATSFGHTVTASGQYATAFGSNTKATGINSVAFGAQATAGSGTAADGAGDYSIAIGLQSAAQATDPVVTGDRSFVLFFDENTANRNSAYNFSYNDRLGLIGGGEILMDDAPASPATRGCIRYRTSALQYSNDCVTYVTFGATATTATNVPLSGITGATAANSIDNKGNAQTWQWTTQTTGNGLNLTSSSATTGIVFNVLNTNNSNASVGKVASFDVIGTLNGAVPVTISNAGVGSSLRVNDDGTYTDTTPVIVDASGNMGVGTGSPGAKLHVSSDGAANPTSIIRAATGQTQDLTQWQTSTPTVLGGVSATGKIYTGATAAGTAQLYVREAANSEVVRFEQNSGSRIFVIDSQGLRFNSTAVFGSTVSWAGVGTIEAYNDIGTREGISVYGHVSQSAALQTWKNSAGTNLAQVSSAGYIGIGVTPSVALDVSGDVEYTGTITDVSDMRLKTDIKPLTERGSMLAKLDAINTYSFVMKDDAKKQVEFGVMAQELETVFPELVKTADDEMKTKSVNYVGMIAPIIEATKELGAENDALKAEIAALKADKEEVHAALEDLSKQVDLLNTAAGNKAQKASMDPWMIGLALLAAFGFSGMAFMSGRALQQARRKN